MEIGTEISHKIRSAIKSKLMELGAYVDEELPDYIMVMVANKKNQAAMTDDLNLFLGGNTEKFTCWLQNLLVKLQSISVSSKKKEEEKASKSAKESSEKSSDKKSSKSTHRKSTEKTSPPTKAKENASKSHKSSHPVKEKSKEKAPVVAASVITKSHKHVSKTAYVSTSPISTETQTDEVTRETSLPDKPEVSEPQVENNESESKSAVEKQSESKSDEPELEKISAAPEEKEESETVTTEAQADQEVEEPEFTVKAEYDEFSEEFSQEAEKAAKAEEAKKMAAKSKSPGTNGTKQSSLPASTPFSIKVAEPVQAAKRPTTVFARISPVITKPAVTEEVVVRSVPLSSRLGAAITQTPQAPVSLVTRRSSSGRKVTLQESAEDQIHLVSTRDSARKAVSGSSVSISGVKRRMPGSVVGTVTLKSRRLVEEVEEEEYDPMNPAVGNVASVVKVTARRSSVPRKLQANKSLLMKAVDEATKSVTRNKVSKGSAYIPLGRTVERVPSKSQSLFTRSKHDEIMRSLKREVLQQPVGCGVITQQPSEDAVSEDESDEAVEMEEQAVLVKQQPCEKRVPVLKVEEVMEDSDYPTDDGDNRLVRVDVDEEVMEMVEEGDVIQVQEEEEEPVSPNTETEEEEEELYLVKTEPVVVKTEPKEPVLTYTPTQLAVPRVQSEVRPKQFARVDARPAKRMVQQDKPPEENEKTRFIVTLDGVDPLKFEDKEPTTTDIDDSSSITSSVSNVGNPVPVVHVLPKRQKVETVSINLTGSDAENDDDEEEGTAVNQNKVAEKCKFWPACANGNQCTYHHPCTPCRSFPNCKFGDKCLYIHPNCKYDAKCTKPDCPFTHASKRSPGVKPVPQYISLPPQTTAVLYPVAASNSIRPNLNPSKPKCKFFPKCTNLNCPFAHPKPCRYGMSCANKVTCLFHHPPLPGKDQFRWSSSGPSTKAEHISERKFDQGPVNTQATSKT